MEDVPKLSRLSMGMDQLDFNPELFKAFLK